MITVLCGGVGAARFLRGLVRVRPPEECTAIVNVGDDLELHGLHISPDIDTVIYTVGEIIDPGRGWGLVDESWRVLEELGNLGGQVWFGLGDRDIARHLYRTHRLSEGASLTDVTDELARAHGLGLHVLPVTDDRLRTMVTVPDLGEIDFQQYFVRHQHALEVQAVRFDGASSARPGPHVIAAIENAELIVIAPSNPLVSIGPILAVPGLSDAIIAARDRVVAVSPIVDGRAIKGPAADMMDSLGYEPSVVGVAQLYAPLASTLFIDTGDGHRAVEVSRCGIRAEVGNTMMTDPDKAASVAEAVLSAALARR